jgi:hypothetical protein
VIAAGRGSSVVEQPIRNRQVVGSTPTLGSNFFLAYPFYYQRKVSGPRTA